MMTLLVMRCLLFTAEALAVSTVLPLLVFVIAAFLRGRAALRHLLWLASFAVLLALPLLALLVPAQVMTLDPGPALPVVVTMAAPVTASYADSWSLDGIIAALLAPLCALWLAGMVFHLSRLALGAHGLRRLYARSIGFAGMDDVRLGDGGPMTFGLRKPVILLPRAAAHWPQARLDAVLRHERAHIARHDSITQLLAELACAFYWPNPLVWLGARRLRRDAEIAADDAVLASGLQASAYATQLVQVAAEFAGRPRLMAMAMAAGSTLEARVTSVLSPEPSRKGVSRLDALKLAALGSVAAFALAMARPDLAWAEVTTAKLPPVAVTQPQEAADSAPMAAPPRHVHRSARLVRAMPPAPAEPPLPAESALPPVPPLPPASIAGIAPMAPLSPHAARDAERAQDRAQERAQRDIARAQAHIARAQERAEADMLQAQARAEAKVERDQDQVEAAIARAQADSDGSPDGHRRDAMRAAIRQVTDAARASTARVMTQVRLEVGRSLAEAKASRDAAIAEARRDIAAAKAQAQAARRRDMTPDED
jgi:beta-lactamase regulating signal transducer with metallopeptidase domain